MLLAKGRYNVCPTAVALFLGGEVARKETLLLGSAESGIDFP
jgi:hypothetical protein